MRPDSKLIIFSRIRLFLLGCAWSGLSGLIAFSDTVTVGDSANPAGLPQAIYDAYAKGARDITLAPGVYDLPSMNHQDTILLTQWTDTIIHANGVTLIFEELGHRPVHFNRCTNVGWEGGTLRFAHPSFTQGRIVAMNTDDKGAYCDWQIDAGYPTDPDPTKSTFDVIDGQTRLIRINTRDWSPTSAEQTAPGSFRFRYAPRNQATFQVNDWLVTRASGGSTVMHMDASENCTIRNVILENAGFAAFFETGGGGNHYLNNEIQPGPRPVGATEDELVGCGADGFHSTQTTVGPDIEDCTFRGVFLDDCIAIHGTFDRVIDVTDSVVTLKSGRPLPKVGDMIRIANMTGYFGQAQCVGVDAQAGKPVKLTLDQALNAPIDHTQDADEKKGTKASDLAFCGRGYRILRCHLGNTRSRGILAKADDGLIDGCVIDGCGMSGVSLGPEFWWGEAGYCENVTVSNNRFTRCNKNNRDQAALWIHGDGAIGNRNITACGNRFDTCFGRFIILAEWTDGVDLADNRIVGSFELQQEPLGNVISIGNCKNIKLTGNLVGTQGQFAGDLIGYGANVSAADVQKVGLGIETSETLR